MRFRTFMILLILIQLTYVAITIKWSKNYGGSLDEIGYKIIQTFDGGYAVVGITGSNDGDVGLNRGLLDAFVAKFDSFGNLEWFRTYGGSKEDYGYDIVQTMDGGFLFVGKTNSNDGMVKGWHRGYNGSRRSYDMWVVKINKWGDLVWQKCLGGSKDDVGNAVVEDEDSFLIVGYTYSPDGDVKFKRDMSDLWVVKLDKEGGIIWEKTYGGNWYEEGRDVEKIEDGYVIVGTTGSLGGDVKRSRWKQYDVWVLKIDRYGDLIWSKTYGGDDLDEGRVIKRHGNGFIVAGITKSDDGDVRGWHEGYTENKERQPDGWIFKIDYDGYIMWQRTIGGEGQDEIFDIYITNSGDCIGVGFTASGYGNIAGYLLGGDGFVFKLNRYGQMQWSRAFGGSQLDVIYSVTVLRDEIVFLGYSSSKDAEIAGNIGGKDIWIMKFSDEGYVNLSEGKKIKIVIKNLTSYTICLDFQTLGAIKIPSKRSLFVDDVDTPFKVFYISRDGKSHYFMYKGKKLIKFNGNVTLEFVERSSAGKEYVVMRIHRKVTIRKKIIRRIRRYYYYPLYIW